MSIKTHFRNYLSCWLDLSGVCFASLLNKAKKNKMHGLGMLIFGQLFRTWSPDPLLQRSPFWHTHVEFDCTAGRGPCERTGPEVTCIAKMYDSQVDKAFNCRRIANNTNKAIPGMVGYRDKCCKSPRQTRFTRMSFLGLRAAQRDAL